MNFIALKMLLGDRLKYISLIAGIAFAAMLMTQQASIFIGVYKNTGSFIRDTGLADLWIMDPYTNFTQEYFPLRDTTLNQVRSVSGIQWAMPMYLRHAHGKMPDGTSFTLYLVGIDDITLIGAPPKMVQGHITDLKRDRAVFIDARTAKSKLRMKNGGGRPMGIGDRFSINDNEVIITGSYEAHTPFFWEPVIYTTYSRAIKYVPYDRNVMSYVIAKTQPGTDIKRIQNTLQQKTGLRAYTHEEFFDIASNYLLTETGILVNFAIAVFLGFVIGVIVAGQTLYNFTLENLRYYGSLKAMGVSNRVLAQMVFLQAITVCAVGYSIGVGLASVMGYFIVKADLAFAMIWQVPVFTAIAILAICFLACLLSLRPVFRLEPAVVFKT